MAKKFAAFLDIAIEMNIWYILETFFQQPES